MDTPIRKHPVDRIFGDRLKGDGTYDAYENDIAVATFYFPRHTATELVSAPSLTPVGFVSQVGGLLGLCLGFSLISGIEILYWFTIGWAENKIKASKRRKISVQSVKH